MESYFSAIQPHIEDKVDFAIIQNTQSSISKAIISLGIDNFIYVRDLSSNDQNRIFLPENNNYRCISKTIHPNKCILGTQNGTLQQFNLQTQQNKVIYSSQFKINSLTNSPNNRYLAVCSDQSKCMLVDFQTLRTSKCRPGHDTGVATVSFSSDEKYLASIGFDKCVVIYNIQKFDQPSQMHRHKICKSQDQIYLTGCFNKVLPIYYAPGQKQLLVIQFLNGKWESRNSNFIKHTDSIITFTKILKTYLLVTSSQQQLFIWNNKNDEKLVVIQNFSLNKIIQINQSFWGSRNDGKIYHYQKVLNQSIGSSMNEPERMQIQNNQNQISQNKNQDVINFDDEQAEQEEQQKQDQKDNISEQQIRFQQQKKSKADKIITSYPQAPIDNSTPFFEDARYIYMSHQGYLIERKESQYETKIEFQSEDSTRNQSLFINKEIQFAQFNRSILVYSNKNTFGVKFLEKYIDIDTWQKTWYDIIAVTCTYNWVAVANQMEIKVFDLTGNQLKTISFDRTIIALAAYQNLLAVVYHQSIPIHGSQCISMQLFVVNNQKSQVLKCSTCHVPIRAQTDIKFFRFSNQGMLISQDTAGFIRVYNLQTNNWSSVIVQGIQDTRKIWILGMNKYQIVYWKTHQINPDFNVLVKLPVKQSRLGTNVAIDSSSEDLADYPFYMFQRFCLDHQKCRNRLWGHLRQSRTQKDLGFLDSKTILTQKQLMKHHNQLDYKFYGVIKFYLKQKMKQKALMSSKTLIRTFQAGKKLIDLFDTFKLRPQAVELEVYYDEKQKQIEYEKMQQMQLQNLRLQAQRQVKPKNQINPFDKKKNMDLSSIPSLNNSQLSQGSNFDNLSQRSMIKETKQNGMIMANKNSFMDTPQKQQVINPFLKKKSTQDDMNIKSKQIDEQIEKYGIKKKAQINKKIPKQF